MKIIPLAQLPEVPTSHAKVGLKKVIIPNGIVPHVTQYAIVRFQSGEIASKHKHLDMYEIFFVQSGSGVIKINQTTQILEKDICIVVAPGEEHEITSFGSGELGLLYFGITVK